MKKQFRKKIILNLTFGLVAILYFTVFGTQYTRLDISILDRYIDLSSLLFLFISIITMEFAYKKSDESIFLYGIEFLIISIFTLLTQYMSKMLNCSIEVYTLSGANIFAIYYILKSGILYTKLNKNELENLSDIKEIVKDEPIKKEAKRKNKKEEEGK